MKIVLNGRVSSKKNSKRIFYNKSTGKPFITSSIAHVGWHEQALADLLEWKYKNKLNKPIQKPVKGIFTFMHKGKMRQDSSNALASIEDVLQDARIIENDDLFYEHHLYKIMGCQEWSTIIEIEDL